MKASEILKSALNEWDARPSYASSWTEADIANDLAEAIRKSLAILDIEREGSHEGK